MTTYQKVIAAYGILRSAINGRMSKYDVAQEFRDSATYAVGRLVIHDDKLYRCTTAHTGPWDANDFVQSTVEEAIIYEIDRAVLAASAEFAEKTDIASEFSRTQRYDVDRLVVYENVLYRCSVAHPAGEWNGDHFVQATVDDVIALNGGLRNIADDFDKTKSYSVGQLVVYDNKLYRCTSAHTGDWTAAHFTTSTVEAALALKALLSDLADEFADGTYSVGQLVKKDGKIYRCTAAHTGAWNGGADFVESTVSGALNLMATKAELSELGSSTDLAISGKIGLDKISGEFSTGTAYSVGQIVRKDGKLYRCETAHAAGPWNSGADFTEAPVSVSVNQMAANIASLNSAIAQTALKSELGYSGNYYNCDIRGHDEIDIADRGIAVLHLYDSESSDQLGEIVVNLPQVSQEDESGSFHATNCMLVVDALDIHDDALDIMSTIVLNGGDYCLQLWNGMRNPYYIETVSMVKLTYLGTINGCAAWFCEGDTAQVSVP